MTTTQSKNARAPGDSLLESFAGGEDSGGGSAGGAEGGMVEVTLGQR